MYADFDNELCYTGQTRDKETGLYYCNARYYDPTYGRFLTQDTYRGEPTDSQTLHLYAYCANDPVNHVDPSGHKASKYGNYYTEQKFVFILWGIFPICTFKASYDWTVRNYKIKRVHRKKIYLKYGVLFKSADNKLIKPKVRFYNHRQWAEANYIIRIYPMGYKEYLPTICYCYVHGYVYNDGGYYFYQYQSI